MFFNFNLRFYLVAGLMLYSTSAWPDKNLLEVAGGECISCDEHDQARAKFNLKAAVFTARDEGRFIKVLRTEPKETDVLIDKNIQGPFRSIGRIQGKHGSDSWRGTAFFISPCHILTNAHTVYSSTDEDKLFANKKDKGTLIIEQETKVRKQINIDLKNVTSNRSIRFEIARDSSGNFDKSKTLKVEELISLDVHSDVAILRVDKCLGVPEAYGSINILPKDKIESEFKKIAEKKTPLIQAGFPGDRHGDPNTDSALKINSSDRYSLESGVQIDHYISNFEGSSGSPIFAMYYRNANGDLKPIDREFMRKPPIGFDPNKVESVLVAMNKSEDSVLGRNQATFMNDDSIMDYVFDDTSENKALITARIEEAKREAGATQFAQGRSKQ